MKKIMFNDRFGLTQAVLDGRKTMTRRIITCPKSFKGEWVAGFHVYTRQSDGAMLEWPSLYDADEATIDGGYILPKYKVGEIVAIAQAYKDFGAYCIDSRAMTNKMFVKAEYMPHQIRITNVRVEKLQDISDEDCIKEGVVKRDHIIPTPSQQIIPQYFPCQEMIDSAAKVGWGRVYDTPREAFADLIDKVSGRGIWHSNPFVFVYEFELVK